MSKEGVIKPGPDALDLIAGLREAIHLVDKHLMSLYRLCDEPVGISVRTLRSELASEAALLRTVADNIDKWLGQV